MITDPKEACEAMLGQKLLGITVENDRVVLTFERDNTIEVDGEDFDLSIYVDQVN